MTTYLAFYSVHQWAPLSLSLKHGFWRFDSIRKKCLFLAILKIYWAFLSTCDLSVVSDVLNQWQVYLLPSWITVKCNLKVKLRPKNTNFRSKYLVLVHVVLQFCFSELVEGDDDEGDEDVDEEEGEDDEEDDVEDRHLHAEPRLRTFLLVRRRHRIL